MHRDRKWLRRHRILYFGSGACGSNMLPTLCRIGLLESNGSHFYDRNAMVALVRLIAV